MEDLEKLKKILNEPITVNNLNRINDYFVRYLFSHTGNEHIALHFINSVFKDSDFATFSKIEIYFHNDAKREILEETVHRYVEPR